MDFGGFICFGFGVLVFLVLGIRVLWLSEERSPERSRSLVIFLVLSVLLGLAAKFLYQEFVLNEGLVGAAMQGKAADVKSFLARGANPESRWEDGRTALQFAKESGNQETIDVLIRAGAKE
jgi:hypothetical protein